MEDESHHHQYDHYNTFPQKGSIFYGQFFIQGENFFHVLRLHVEVPPIHEEKDGYHHGQNDQYHRAGVDNKVGKAQTGGAADHDVGRVTDEGSGTADVGGHDLREQKRHRIDLQDLGNGNGHGADQQHRGDVIQKGGEHRGDDREYRQDSHGLAPGQLGRPDGDVLKQAGALDHGHKEHHAHQHADGIQIHIVGGGFNGKYVGQQQDHRSGQRSHAAVYFFRDDGGHHQQEYAHRNHLLQVHTRSLPSQAVILTLCFPGCKE